MKTYCGCAALISGSAIYIYGTEHAGVAVSVVGALVVLGGLVLAISSFWQSFQSPEKDLIESRITYKILRSKRRKNDVLF